MWTRIKEVPNLTIAAAWQEVLEESSVPCEIRLVEAALEDEGHSLYGVYVPNDRVHIAELVIQAL